MQRLLVDRRRGCIPLEVAGHRDRPGAERAEALAVNVGLGDDMGHVLEQRFGDVGALLPRLERAIGQPAVDQDLRDVTRAELKDGHRPDLGFRDDGKVGPPMVEEPADRRLEVERHILVDDTVAETLLGHLRGGDRASGQHDVDAVVENAFDDGDDGNRLADARGVHPDQWPFRTRAASHAVAFATAGTVLLALGRAPGDVGADQRIGRGAGKPVRCQHGARPALAHRRPSTRR